jgi:hypothetical protein
MLLNLDNHQNHGHDCVGDVDVDLLVVSKTQDLSSIGFEDFERVPIEHSALLDQVMDREEVSWFEISFTSTWGGASP